MGKVLAVEGLLPEARGLLLLLLPLLLSCVCVVPAGFGSCQLRPSEWGQHGRAALSESPSCRLRAAALRRADPEFRLPQSPIQMLVDMWYKLTAAYL